MNWSASIDPLEGERVHQYRLSDKTGMLTWADVVHLWRRDAAFADWFGGLLAQCPFVAFFWETPPINTDRWQDPFEFVLVDSPTLTGVAAEPRPFRAHLSSPEPVVQFANLGGDAYLIAPTDRQDATDRAHLAAFVRTAPAQVNRALWKAIGGALRQRVSPEPLWCSTSGLGVYWLHVRLDSYPKYYTYAPYRKRP
jgi:hypothetical protein